MRVIRNLTGTLFIAGMASMAIAWSPRASAEPMSSPATASAAQQEQTTPPKQDDAKPPKDTKGTKDAKDTRDAKAPKADQQPMNPKQPEKADRNQPKGAGERPGQAEKAKPAGAHGRISDGDYRTHFGRSHSFTVRQVVTTTRIVPNQTQFAYGGYTFIFLAPWPSEWVLTDDCYVDYIDGEYVLIDLAHPGMQIALQIAE
jgi:hypothetical protein